MYTTSVKMKKILLSKGYFPQSTFPEYFALKKTSTSLTAETCSHPYIIFVPKNHSDWRQYSLAHPIFYEKAVIALTEPTNWQTVLDLLVVSKNELIEVASQHIFSLNLAEDPKKINLPVWREFSEKMPPKYATSYSRMLKTDIQNFYPSVYTHSIEWALNTGFGKAKIRRSPTLPFGTILDKAVRNQNAKRTNGILVGSLLSDIVSEIVLCLVDQLLYEKLQEYSFTKDDIKILRFKDDYRILYNKEDDGRIVYKCLSEALRELNLKLNTDKTAFYEDIILDYEREWKTLRRQKKIFLYKFDDKQSVSTHDLILVLGDIFKYQQAFPQHHIGASLLPELNVKLIQVISSSNIATIINLTLKICTLREGNVASAFLFFDRLILDKKVIKNDFFKELEKYLIRNKDKDLRDLYVMWIYRLCLSHKYSTVFLISPSNSILIKHLLSSETNCSSIFKDATGYTIIDKPTILKLRGKRITPKEVSPY